MNKIILYFLLIIVFQSAIPVLSCDHRMLLCKAEDYGGRIFNGDRKITETEIQEDLRFVHDVTKIDQALAPTKSFQNLYTETTEFHKKNLRFMSFANLCKRIYEQEDTQGAQTAIHMLFELVSEETKKYKIHTKRKKQAEKQWKEPINLRKTLEHMESLGFIEKKGTSSDPFGLFDSHVIGTSSQESPDKTQHVHVKVEGPNMHKNLRLLQTPYFEIDLSDRHITIEELSDLIPIAPQIVSLKLMRTNLNNNVLPIIECLTAITYLDLSDNHFQDQELPFGSLVCLRTLRMANTQISRRALGGLLPLKKLEILGVGGNPLKNAGIEIIFHIPSLTDVDVTECGFDQTVIPLFLNLPKLKTLKMCRNLIDGAKLEEFLQKAKEQGVGVITKEKL